MVDKRSLLLAGLIASGTVLLDYFGHLYLTSPMELPEYFVAKWFGAFLVSMLLVYFVRRIKIGSVNVTHAVSGGVLFAVYAGLYYGYVAPWLNIPVLAAPYSIEILGMTGSGNWWAWALLHFGAFYLAYRFVERTR